MSDLSPSPEYSLDDNAFREQNPMAEFLRMERMPHIWCPGCGIGTVVTSFAEAIKAGGYDMDKIAVVSGIGCTGRVAGYVKFDSFHTTHGRAIPFATGLKLANPELKVVVISGDGDLTEHRRQPPHPCRPPQHGHDRHLREQLHLRHDRRAGDADDPDFGQRFDHAIR